MYSSNLNKSELRKLYLAKRKAISETDIEDYSAKIFENFSGFFDLSNVKRAHCFLPIKKFNEINTQLFIDYFWKNKIEVYVPKIIGDDIISVKFEKYTELLENSWGIMEPQSNQDISKNNFDLVITPLVYCDKKGNRIGYGKGFYDQFFTKLNSDVLKVGISFFEPQEIIENAWKNDIRLDYLVTPTEILSFADGISKLTK